MTVPSGSNLNWESSNTDVCTVDQTGLVTGVGEGSATVTASFVYEGATVSDSASVEVERAEEPWNTYFDFDFSKSQDFLTLNFQDSNRKTYTDYSDQQPGHLTLVYNPNGNQSSLFTDLRAEPGRFGGIDETIAAGSAEAALEVTIYDNKELAPTLTLTANAENMFVIRGGGSVTIPNVDSPGDMPQRLIIPLDRNPGSTSGRAFTIQVTNGDATGIDQVAECSMKFAFVTRSIEA